MTAQDRRVLTLTVVLLVTAALTLSGWPAVAGPFVFVSIALTLAVGYGDDARRGRITVGITLYCTLFVILILTLFALHDPSRAEPRLLAGLPADTAILVYLIWPLGASAGLLYALEFRRAVLSDERLAELERKLAAARDSSSRSQ